MVSSSNNSSNTTDFGDGENYKTNSSNTIDFDEEENDEEDKNYRIKSLKHLDSNIIVYKKWLQFLLSIPNNVRLILSNILLLI